MVPGREERPVMNKNKDNQPLRYARRVSETDASDIMIRFSPEVLRGMARLEAAVHDSEYFNPAILENLQEYSTGKPISVPSALTGIAHFTREAMDHVNATGDNRAKEGLDGFISDLLGLTDSSPIMVVNERARNR